MENFKKNSNQPFKLPDGYFEKLQDQVLSKTTQEDSGFKMPENYFEGMQESVLRKSTSTPPMTIIKRPSRTLISIAASLVVLFFATFIMYERSTSSTVSEDILLAVSEDEADEYLDIISDEMSLEQLADLIEIEDIEETEFIEDFPTDFIDEVDLEELEELL